MKRFFMQFGGRINNNITVWSKDKTDKEYNMVFILCGTDLEKMTEQSDLEKLSTKSCSGPQLLIQTISEKISGKIVKANATYK